MYNLYRVIQMKFSASDGKGPVRGAEGWAVCLGPGLGPLGPPEHGKEIFTTLLGYIQRLWWGVQGG